MTPNPGAVPDGWHVARLGDVARVETGGTPSRAQEAYWGGEIPWMASGEIKQRRVESTAERITQEGLRHSNARLFPVGTVMVAMNGQGATRGKAAVLGIKATCNQSLAAVSGRHSENRFLFHVLNSSYEALRGLTGGGRNGLNLRLIRGFRLPLPPLAEQRAIAAVLDSIDEAIERTEEVIAATERLRDALLHELLTRGLPGRHSRWADVPGLGTVPACWDVVRLGDSTTVRNGTTPSRSRAEYWEGGDVPFVKTSRVNDVSIEQPDEFITSRAVESAGAVIVPAGSVLIAMIGQGRTRGKAARLRFDAAINQNFAAVYGAADELSLDFVFLWAQHNYSAIRNRGQGTNQDALNCDLVEGLRLPRPSAAEQDDIAAAVDVMSERGAAEGRLLRELHHAKAAAADALLTGRVRLKVGGSA